MKYMVKAKKDITERGKQRSGNNLSTVIVKLAVLESANIPENRSKKQKVRIIQNELKTTDIELNPYKFDLNREEEVMVQPVVKVGEDGRRTQFRESIFDDTWTTVKIPEQVRRKWKRDNRDIIKARQKERRKRGLDR